MKINPPFVSFSRSGRLFTNYTTATARSSVLNVLKSKKELAMPMVSHLFGSPTLSGRVGKNGANSPIDVRIIKALLNTYQRKNGRPSLPMDTVDTDTLVTHIENFQKQQMKVRVWVVLFESLRQ